MKLLLAMTNSTYSLVGFDWDTGRMFWGLSTDVAPGRSACYFQGGLLVSANRCVFRFTPDRLEMFVF